MPRCILLIVLLLLSIAPAPRAAQPVATPEVGITGRVLTPDGTPVTQGNVALVTSPSSRVNAAIDRTGHFRILPDGQGWRRLFISVPEFAPHRINCSSTLALMDLCRRPCESRRKVASRS